MANLIAQARAPSTWTSAQSHWKKWLTFCQADRIEPLAGDPPALLRYLGWLHTETTISASSVRNYVSAVITAHARLEIEIPYTPMLQLALGAFQKADIARKATIDPTTLHERRGLPASIARSIFDAALHSPPTAVEFVRNAAAVITSYMFFERGEASSALELDNIRVTPSSVQVAITLRKAQGPVAHTLSYNRLGENHASPIDLLVRYDTWRRSAATSSKYFWALPGHRLRPAARLTTTWLDRCLSHLKISPPPQVSWSSHSLRIGAASESASINVPLYRIRVWGDWSPTSQTFETHYLDARVLPSGDSYFFFGHLLGSEPRLPVGPSHNA